MEEQKALGFEFKCMNNLIKRQIHARMAAAGFDEVTIMHGYIIGFLYRNQDKDIYQRDIEEHFGITKSTVTSIIKLMEKKEYVSRCSVEADARLKKLTLTPKGIEIHNNTIRVIDKLHEDMERGITEEEKRVFRSVVGKMRDNMVRSNKEDE